MRLIVLIAVAVLMPAIAGSAPADYRLAGVLSISEGRSLAIIEKSPGDTVLVRVGDRVGGGEVVAIGSNSVKLRFDDGEVRLTLSGAPANEREVQQAGNAPGATTDDSMRTVPIKQTLIALDRIEASLPTAIEAGNETVGGRTAERAAEETAAKDTKEAGKQLATALAGLFKLPTDVAIENINGESFRSAKEGLAKVMRTVGDGEVVRLEMQQTPDHPVFPVYINPR